MPKHIKLDLKELKIKSFQTSANKTSHILGGGSRIFKCESQVSDCLCSFNTCGKHSCLCTRGGQCSDAC